MKQANHGVNTSIIASSANTSNYYIVRIRVTYGGKRVDLRPGIRLENKDQWQAHRVKRGCKVFGHSYNDINRRLTRYEEWIDEYFLTCEEHHLEPKRIRLVHHDIHAPASLLLIEGRKDGKPGLKAEAPFLIHGEDGAETEEYRRICHRI